MTTYTGTAAAAPTAEAGYKTAFNAMLDLARRVGQAIEETVVTGSTSTIVCARLASIPDASIDDSFNLGTAFIVTDAGGAGIAPEGEVVRISDYAGSTGTVTTTDLLTVAPAVGDAFALTKIPRHELYQAINAALQDLGPVPSEDVSLTSAASTRSYTVPNAAKRDLRQVWIASRTSEPYDWEEQFYWHHRHNTSTYDLVLVEQPSIGYLIRLVYVAPHAILDAPTESIQQCVPYDYLIWRAAYHHYRLRLHYPGKDEKRWTGLMNEAAEYAAQALNRHPIRLPKYTTRLWYSPEPSTADTVSITTEGVG